MNLSFFTASHRWVATAVEKAGRNERLPHAARKERLRLQANRHFILRKGLRQDRRGGFLRVEGIPRRHRGSPCWEEGRGFAVVAGNVRELAEKTVAADSCTAPPKTFRIGGRTERPLLRLPFGQISWTGSTL